MSDEIKHECGLALIRLKKPLQYYQDTYGTPLFGIRKLELLLQKQRNRGQDGAGLATLKLDPSPGSRFISQQKSNSPACLEDIFSDVYQCFRDIPENELADAESLKAKMPFLGELLLGHLRYGTHGKNSLDCVHPFIRRNNWITRSLVLAGNFNLTNVNELFEELLSFGQHPLEKSDTVTVMEKISYFLDEEVERLFQDFRGEGHSRRDITALVAKELDVTKLLKRASERFDGGYVMAGMIGHGDAFVLRDPNGIRPAYWYEDEEVVVAASERPAIQTSIGSHFDDIKELKAGHALIIKKDGSVFEEEILKEEKRSACSFERIYFSRGSDRDIYNERKLLGKKLAPRILERIGNDVENTIFSFIPNTAETAFYGLVEGLNELLDEVKKTKILELESPSSAEVDKILKIRPRVEKLAIKDAKMRTFIADDVHRGSMVSHVYDVTYGLVKNGQDTIVVIDDSIVRGTTLRNSIIQILDSLNPKRILVVSSAPQIRYPDCYGIDMSKMKSFVAFEAMVRLVEKEGKQELLQKTYEECKAELTKTEGEILNPVKRLYERYSDEQVSEMIAEIITPPEISAEVDVIYQSVEDLNECCPSHTGDWYFSGDYPTSGGVRVVNQAFVNFIEKRDSRAY